MSAVLLAFPVRTEHQMEQLILDQLRAANAALDARAQEREQSRYAPEVQRKIIEVHELMCGKAGRAGA